jgi:hypothetical protein
MLRLALSEGIEPFFFNNNILYLKSKTQMLDELEIIKFVFRKRTHNANLDQNRIMTIVLTVWNGQSIC